jgi:hypothetical protein
MFIFQAFYVLDTRINKQQSEQYARSVILVSYQASSLPEDNANQQIQQSEQYSYSVIITSCQPSSLPQDDVNQ